MMMDYETSSGSEQLPSVEEVRMMEAARRSSTTGSVSSKVSSDVETAYTGTDDEDNHVHDQLPSVEDVRMNHPRRSGKATFCLTVGLLGLLVIIGVVVAVVLTQGGNTDEEFPHDFTQGEGGSSISGSNNINIDDKPSVSNPAPTYTFLTSAPQAQVPESEPVSPTATPAPAPTTASGTSPTAVSPTEPQKPTLEQIVQLISSLGVSRLEDLQKAGSPQEQAARWLAEEDPTPVSLTAADQLVERYVVVVFYYSTGGPNWPNKLNLLTEGSVCLWYLNGVASDHMSARKYGISCSVEGGAVNSIHIPSNFLTGPLPIEMNRLKDLEHFEVFNNPGIGGFGFPSFLRDMPKLNYVGLHYCGVTGQLPVWLGSMTALRSLVLSNNNLSGELPTSIAQLTGLEDLYLDDNNMEGATASLGALRKLQHLILEDNRFTGNLADWNVQNWGELEVMDISHNRIKSSIPTALFALPKVRILDLHGNDLLGSLPKPNGANTALEVLTLNENDLTGELPSEVSLFSTLKQFDISRNKFTSTLPDSLGGLSNLELLYAAENPFNAAAIPSFIAKLTALKELSLKDTQRVDTIPNWFGGMSNLMLLDLDDNRLVNSIPASLGNAVALEYLLIQRNQLTGSIPSSLSSLSKLAFFMVDKNDLTGNAQPVCGMSEIPRFFSADCGGTSPEIVCECCTVCCSEEDQSCNDKVWLADSNPIWELDFQRNGIEFDASASRTYTVQFGGDIP